MGIKQYCLMHKNIAVAVLSVDSDTFSLYDCDVFQSEHMPIKNGDKKALKNWIERRAVPKHQKGTERILGGAGNFEYMMQNLGLSLIDCYWFKPADKDMRWEDVDLFTHDFAEKDFSYIDKENMTPFKPSATTQGELQKRWVIKDGERYLVKGNYGPMYRQSINEVVASLLHQKQSKDHVVYELTELPTTLGEGLGCVSKDFANENMEFIPAYDITFFEKQKNNESVLENYIRACVLNGIPEEKMRDCVDYQIMSDFLLTNTDRHLLNLGILRNPDTLEFIKPAPIFDTGNSMFFNTRYNEQTVLDIPVTSFYKTELKMLDAVKNKNVLNLGKIPTEEELRNLYSKDPYSVVYLDNLIDGYKKKVELIGAFQKGYSLNPRSTNYYKNFTEESKEEHDDLE